MARALLTSILALVALAPAAGAAVPRGFFGMNVDGPVLDGSFGLDNELRLIGKSGAGRIRVAFSWAQAEPVKGQPTDFRETDRLVAAAAVRRLPLLPVVLWAPEWARRDPGALASPPEVRPYGAFLAKLVKRYGPQGTFWAERPALRPAPLREWQIWNEPNGPYFWTLQPGERDYAALLKHARTRIRGVDRGARIVMAGLVQRSWESLDRLYRAGVKGRFDVLALHPYTDKPRDLLRIVELNRRVTRRFGDARVPIYLTEISWPSSRRQTGRRFGYETTEPGQAARIREALPLVARARRRLRVERLYWYTWLSRDTSPDYPFDYSGLRKLRKGKAVAKPAFGAFRETVAALRR